MECGAAPIVTWNQVQQSLAAKHCCQLCNSYWLNMQPLQSKFVYIGRSDTTDFLGVMFTCSSLTVVALSQRPTINKPSVQNFLLWLNENLHYTVSSITGTTKNKPNKMLLGGWNPRQFFVSVHYIHWLWRKTIQTCSHQIITHKIKKNLYTQHQLSWWRPF